MTPRTLIHLPSAARVGEVVMLRATIAHDMETGYRSNAMGDLIPRNLITRFECRLESGESVFAADLAPSISANPYLSFPMKVSGAVMLHFIWTGDRGFRHEEVLALLPVS